MSKLVAQIYEERTLKYLGLGYFQTTDLKLSTLMGLKTVSSFSSLNLLFIQKTFQFDFENFKLLASWYNLIPILNSTILFADSKEFLYSKATLQPLSFGA